MDGGESSRVGVEARAGQAGQRRAGQSRAGQDKTRREGRAEQQRSVWVRSALGGLWSGRPGGWE